MGGIGPRHRADWCPGDRRVRAGGRRQARPAALRGRGSVAYHRGTGTGGDFPAAEARSALPGTPRDKEAAGRLPKFTGENDNARVGRQRRCIRGLRVRCSANLTVPDNAAKCYDVPNCAAIPENRCRPADQAISVARGLGRVQHPRVGLKPGRHDDRVLVLPWREPRRDPAGLVHVAPARRVTVHASTIAGGGQRAPSQSRWGASLTYTCHVPPVDLGRTSRPGNPQPSQDPQRAGQPARASGMRITV